VASILYGEPRVTHDIDIVLELPVRTAPRLAEAFDLDEFYCPPEEVIRIEAARGTRGHFNLIHHETGFKADVYLADGGPLHGWALDHRRRIEIDGGHLWVAPPEYVILSKLAWYREGRSDKHLRDIRAMLDVSGEQIDIATIDGWVDRLDLKHQWRLVHQRTDEP
jgi:hypothetical protein